MKLAIVHDELMRRGGAEQVVKCFHASFPEAPIYTMAYSPDFTYSEFKKMDIKTSWFQRFSPNEKRMKALFFPVGLLAMKQLDLRKFDVILISSTYCAKYVKISPTALVINYCYTPFRLAWNPQSYIQYEKATGIKKTIFDIVIKILRRIDFKSAQRANYYIAMTGETRERIKEAYKYNEYIEIIKPPVDCSKFYESDEIKGYYLVVSRLEYYKKVDLVIEAFNHLGYPLIIVGRGSMENELKKKAKSNIQFKSGLSSSEIAQLYSECEAFIFPQHEDYGITPLEANASGRPVIAYGAGGVLETMIPYNGTNEEKCTSVFFASQTKESLMDAVRKASSIKFDKKFIRNHAEKFDEKIFIEKIKDFVESKHNYQTKQIVK